MASRTVVGVASGAVVGGVVSDAVVGGVASGGVASRTVVVGGVVD